MRKSTTIHILACVGLLACASARAASAPQQPERLRDPDAARTLLEERFPRARLTHVSPFSPTAACPPRPSRRSRSDFWVDVALLRLFG